MDAAALHDGPLDGHGDDAPLHDGEGDRRYADIYDFAPVGLLSVDSQGRLVETNLAAAILLGISRSQCHQYRFADFLDPGVRSVFEAFHREVLSGRCRRHCDLALQPGAHRGPVVVRLQATVDESGEENRMVMIDVSSSREPQPSAPQRSASFGLRSAPCIHDNLAPSPSAPSAWAA